ncbi:hypothetical protein CXB51_030321 [Gossypium anomalum]|uniref:Myb/SANT-like domain-containing protein n=1 Tax=Gossypium anomalum TaxID=47600 RepID=A0A8J6CM00_9ROSI|nr:hypothetical protein CXB51_030321 [Gossypium anomalum]
MSTSVIEVSGEKVKAMWDKRLTEIFCDICIKEILKGNRPGTHFTKDGWLKIMTNFEKETGKGFSQRQLKNRWDALKKEWKAWKKLKGEDTSLGWNPIKRTVDASDDWWESRLKVVPEAKKFRTSGIDPEFEGKLDQMFMGIVATGDKAWAPSSGTLRCDIFEDVNTEIPEENKEENVRNDVRILNDVHVSNDVQIDGNGQKRKNPEISSSHFKTGRKKSSKQIGGAARLSSQIEKLCNAADNMSQATSSLTPVMDPYGIPQAVKVLESMSCNDPNFTVIGKVMSIVENYRSDDSDDEREKKKILQRMECFNRLFVIASSSVQLYYEKIAIGAIDGTHIAAILPPNEQIPYIGRKCIPTQNVMAVCDFNMCFTFVMAGWEGSAHDTRIFLDAIRDPKYKFPHPPNGKYYLVDSGYPQMKSYLGPYRGQRYHLPDFRRGRPVSGKKEVFNHSHSSLRSVIERTFGVLKKKWVILRDMPSYSFEKQTMIVVAAMTIHNFIRKHAGRNDADFMEYEDINWAYENNIDLEIVHGRESDDDDDDDDGDDDGESNDSSGFEMELTRDAIASSLMNSL